MSAKTRIVVLHMKKLVFAGVITGLGILLVIFLGILLAGFFLIQIQCLNRRRRSEDRVHRFLPDHI